MSVTAGGPVDTVVQAVIICVMAVVPVVSGSAMAPAPSASTVVGDPITAVANSTAWPPSELIPSGSVWRRLLSDLPPLIMRCTTAAASVGVRRRPLASVALPIGKTRLKTGAGQ